MSVFYRDMSINQQTDSGETLLHLVVKQFEHVYIEQIVEHGADLDVKDNIGNTPLHDLALKAGYEPDNIEVRSVLPIHDMAGI